MSIFKSLAFARNMLWASEEKEIISGECGKGKFWRVSDTSWALKVVKISADIFCVGKESGISWNPQNYSISELANH